MGNETNIEFERSVARTIESLRHAKEYMGNSRNWIGAAIRIRAINGTERKLLEKAIIDISEAFDKVQIVIDSKKILHK